MQLINALNLMQDKDAQKKTMVKGRPLNEIVHDLRTPLATIMGFSEMLLRKHDQKQPLKREWIDMVITETKRLQLMIDQELSEG